MKKIGIIGCGKIADQHVDQIVRIPDCEIVGVFDSEVLMAKQLYERYDIKNYFNEMEKFFDAVAPGIVHITTPPQSHFELGMKSLRAGCHIYMEKPFTVNTQQAIELIDLAMEKNLKITVGHNAQFTHAANRMRELIKSGFLGGPPVHMESYYCYNLGDERYAKSLLGDKEHWVRKLPGKLLQNIISHGISKIAEFLEGDSIKVIAHGFTSSILKNINENDITDELRVIIQDSNATTAYFTFSSQMSPILHQLRIYGPKNALIVDDDHQTLIKMKGTKYKSYLENIIPPAVFAKEYISNSMMNIKKFIKSDLHMSHGMKYLIESFYKSISDGSPLPISYKEILITSRIMDDIFSQLKQYNPEKKGI